MPDERIYKTKDYVLFILGLIGYIAVIMVPSVLLALHFPKYGLLFLSIGAVLCFAGPGLMIGLEWIRATSSEQKSIKQFGADLLWLLVIITLPDAFSGWRFHSLTFFAALIFVSIITFSTLSAFFIGRYISEKRINARVIT